MYNKTEIEEVKGQIARLKAEQEKNVKAKKENIALSRARGAMKEILAKLEQEVAEYEAGTSKLIEVAQKRLAELQYEAAAKEEKAQEQARAHLAELKEQARVKWLAKGGKAEDFPAAWAEMEKEILKQQVMADIQPGKSASPSLAGRDERFVI